MATLTSAWTNIKSGSFSSGGATLTYYIDAKLDSQSVANNKSTVSTRARTYFTGYVMGGAGYEMKCTGCPTSSGTGVIYYNDPDKQGTYHTYEKTRLTGSTTVTHNDNGTGSLSMSGSCKNTYLGMNISIDGSIDLPTIARASQPSINTWPDNSPNFTVGDTITIHMNRKSTSFTHTVSINIGGTAYEIATGVTDNCQLDTSTYFSQFMAQLTTAKSYSSTVSVATYNGETLIGTKTCNYTANVNSTAYKPTIGTITQSDRNTTTEALESSGVYIKGKSNFKAIVNFGVSDSTYVSLASASIKCGTAQTTFQLSGTSGSATFYADAINGNSLEIAVTDARGVTTSQTVNLTVLDYTSVSFAETVIELYRVNSSGASTETGECIHYKATVNCFDGSFGQTVNTITLKCKYKTTSSDAYSQDVTLATHTATAEQGETVPLGTNTTYTFEGIITGNLFSYSNEYNIIFAVEDLLSSAQAPTRRINQGIPVFAWGEEHFGVFGEFHVHNRTDPTKYITINSDGWHWNLFGTETGTTFVQYDHTNFSELMFVAKYVENASYTWIATAVIPKEILVSTDQMIMLTARIAQGNANDFGVIAQANTSGASLYAFTANRAYVTANAEFSVYYR